MECPYCGFYHLEPRERCARCKKKLQQTTEKHRRQSPKNAPDEQSRDLAQPTALSAHAEAVDSEEYDITAANPVDEAVDEAAREPAPAAAIETVAGERQSGIENSADNILAQALRADESSIEPLAREVLENEQSLDGENSQGFSAALALMLEVEQALESADAPDESTENLSGDEAPVGRDAPEIEEALMERGDEPDPREEEILKTLEEELQKADREPVPPEKALQPPQREPPPPVAMEAPEKDLEPDMSSQQEAARPLQDEMFESLKTPKDPPVEEQIEVAEHEPGQVSGSNYSFALDQAGDDSTSMSRQRRMIEEFFNEDSDPAAEEFVEEAGDEQSMVEIETPASPAPTSPLPCELPFDGEASASSPSGALRARGVRELKEPKRGMRMGETWTLTARRLGAGLFDLAVWITMGLAMFKAAQIITGLAPLHGSAWQWAYMIVLPIAIMAAILAMVYGSLFASITGRTPGMMIFGLTMQTTDGRMPKLSKAFIRTGILILSLVPLGLGLILMWRGGQTEWFHDRLAGVRVQIK